MKGDDGVKDLRVGWVLYVNMQLKRILAEIGTERKTTAQVLRSFTNERRWPGDGRK